MSKAQNFVEAHNARTPANNDDYPSTLKQLLDNHDVDSSEAQEDGSVKHTFDDGSAATTQPGDQLTDDQIQAMVAAIFGDEGDEDDEGEGDDDGSDDEGSDSEPQKASA